MGPPALVVAAPGPDEAVVIQAGVGENRQRTVRPVNLQRVAEKLAALAQKSSTAPSGGRRTGRKKGRAGGNRGTKAKPSRNRVFPADMSFVSSRMPSSQLQPQHSGKDKVVVKFSPVDKLTSRAGPPQASASASATPIPGPGAGAGAGAGSGAGATTSASDRVERAHVASCRCASCVVRLRARKQRRDVVLRYKCTGNVQLIRSTFDKNGFVPCAAASENWNVLWVSSGLRGHVYERLQRFQKVNQFPRTYEITRKDELCRNMMRMQELFGKRKFGFFPRSFVLPADRVEFEQEVRAQLDRHDEASSAAVSGTGTGTGTGTGAVTGTGTATATGNPIASSPKLWIVKPAASACGRGIYVTDNMGQISVESADKNLLVSEYIARPLLMDGRKFDLRVYVAVTSFHPLRIYRYEQGLVRLTTEQYDATDLGNKFVHLTNYSVQKKSEKFVPNTSGPASDSNGNSNSNSKSNSNNSNSNSNSNNQEEEQEGEREEAEQESQAETASKWGFDTLRARLRRDGHDPEALFANMDDLIVKTLISIEPQVVSAMQMHVRHPGNCFQLFGFDVLIDEALKPWLLEVNLGPSMACDSRLDLAIKSTMVSDLFTLAGVQPHPISTPTALPMSTRGVASASDTTVVAAKANQFVRQLASEKHRAGDFTAIYPTDKAQKYTQFFTEKRPYNVEIIKSLA